MRGIRFMAPVLTVLAAVGSTTTARAQSSSPPAGTSSGAVDLMTLRLMLQKGVITQAEYDSALRDMADTSGVRAADTNSLVIGKWSATLYGFAETDFITDSTESFSDTAGAGLIARPGTYAAGHPRTQFSIRNSRFGFRFRAPEYHHIRASALIESDFYGDWAAPTYVAATGQPTENQYFTNPALRVRHAYLKVEAGGFEFLAGQTWHLFGWQSAYHPNSVQVQGLPGQLYARTPQLRITKTFSNKDVTFDIAIAAMRPPQRDSAIPEGEAALHFAINNWTATNTMGATGTVIAPASIAVSGDLRAVAVPDFPTATTKSTYDISKVGGSFAVDAFLPVIPSSREHMGNSLSLVGEFVDGQGIVDMYTGLVSGVGFPTVPNPVTPANPTGVATPTVYNPQIDTGIVTINPMTQAVSFIEWRTIRGGLQYYFPGMDGKMWLSGNYANVSSPNAGAFFTTTTTPAMGMTPAKTTTTKGTLLSTLNFFDVNLMGDVTPAVRLGVEYAYYTDKYADGVSAPNHRVQGSAYYIF
jgi:hypothetical protein